MAGVKLVKGCVASEHTPNGMKLYTYRGKYVTALNSRDVPNRFKFLYPNTKRNS